MGPTHRGPTGPSPATIRTDPPTTDDGLRPIPPSTTRLGSAGGFGSIHSPKGSPATSTIRSEPPSTPTLMNPSPTAHLPTPLSAHGAREYGTRGGGKAGQTSTSGESAPGPPMEHRFASSASTCGYKLAAEKPSMTDNGEGCYGARSAAHSSEGFAELALREPESVTACSHQPWAIGRLRSAQCCSKVRWKMSVLTTIQRSYAAATLPGGSAAIITPFPCPSSRG